MRLVERIDDLNGIMHRLLNRKRSFGNTGGKRFALEILHHQIIDAVLDADVVQRADMRMAKRRDGAGFALKALAVFGIGGQIRRQHFQGDGAFQARIARAVDLAHAAGTGTGDNFVRTEAAAWSERHN
jgi:hypothetical protein